MPPAQFRQVFLEDWTLTDASGIINTVTDGTRTTSILTNAVAGSAVWDISIKDFLGGPIFPATGFQAIWGCAERVNSWANSFDAVGVGVLNGPHGTATRVAAGGLRQSGNLSAANDLSSGANLSAVSNRFVFACHCLGGKFNYGHYAYGYTTATAYDALRGTTDGDRLWEPTHLRVTMKNNGANIQTFEIAVGFFILPSIPLVISPRA